LNNSDFDKNGLDGYGIHLLQYAAFAVSGFAIFTTWAFFYDESFHNFVMNILKVINCSGFNCNGAFKNSMANPDQKTILIDNEYEEIKNICINLQKDTDATNLEVKSLLRLIMNEWEEKEEQTTGFGFR
tara:strand:+ start:401 stop:787 length:387 start_codon:yes stop_codon:yes gene_type:complete